MNPNSSFLSGDFPYTLDPGCSDWLPHIGLLRFKLVDVKITSRGRTNHFCDCIVHACPPWKIMELLPSSLHTSIMVYPRGSSLFVGNLRVFSPSGVTHGDAILPFCPTAVLLFFFRFNTTSWSPPRHVGRPGLKIMISSS